MRFPKPDQIFPLVALVDRNPQCFKFLVLIRLHRFQVGVPHMIPIQVKRPILNVKIASVSDLIATIDALAGREISHWLNGKVLKDDAE